jgi:ankyrin repeat protein
MQRVTARFIAALAGALAIMLSGCASVGYSPGGARDAERLNSAIETDDVHFIRGAIEAREITPNQRVVTPGYSDGAPLLTIAARAAALEVMRYLILAGADLNARTPPGETPLMLAAFFFDDSGMGRSTSRHEQAVRLLVAAGADLENLPHHYSALAYAAYQGNERVVRFLLERGAKVDSGAYGGGTYVNTPLMMAAIQGHEAIVKTLLRAGANADIRVYGGHTAAEFAAKYNHSSLAQLLFCAQRQYGSSGFGPQCQQFLGAN